MRNKLIFALVIVGTFGGFISAYLYAIPAHPLPPAFKPASNPYADGIYANGMVESSQSNGENINIYPEVSGVVTEVRVAEGARVEKGTPLVVLDDSVQRAVVEQQQAQAAAALAMLHELKAQPRRENLKIAEAQVVQATASLKMARDTFEKQDAAYKTDSRAVSKDVLDNDANAADVAKANLDVVNRQYELTRAGAWSFDVENQQRLYESLTRQAASSAALLAKYTIRAPADGVVFSIQTTAGGYVSPQGAYETYTQGFAPMVVMGTTASEGYLDVRTYIDEILIARMPKPSELDAWMFIRGTDVNVPLEFVRVQPYVSPKIQLSDERLEKVDVRVLPVIFRFRVPANVNIYPGELVDVYVGKHGVPSAPQARL